MAIQEINVAIIDDQKISIKNLREEIESFREPKLNVLFTTTDPATGLKKTLYHKPDILFLDIEMPGKSGIELLRDLHHNSDFDCHVVFQTNYEKYTIEALREAAFDFIIKPVERPDLSNVVNRFLKLKYKSSFRDKINRINNEGNQRISLPTVEGLLFLQKNEIICIQYVSYEKGIKPYWSVMVYDNRKIILRRNIKGQDILGILNSHDFFMINSGTILNLNHLSFVDYKSRDCIMVPPFDKTKHTIARNKMGKFKERYDNLH
ncbi:LytR/AlgR family response regulator transcription factor [Maribellus maritimus]|uniref:LytR/AlgR family response regulator transcription factor n=1 Tax=Maribellus maritimus TaxID=2870838 RepID=UPI001EEAA3AB|nr:response regulator transcription factor [Maribellus maritimus]MCG6186521.1 response regulator transcription factor [Maribellus maritimus]